MFLETEYGRKMYLLRITSYSAYFADALRFPGRGVLRDKRWQFPAEGMTRKGQPQHQPREQQRDPWDVRWFDEETTR